ncbi:TPA: DNA adenine methylase, partial [Streptococcus equi subsp. equi]|nr:DNA adenine methylase [Streptococcus equi subsp. equi]
NEIVLDPFIGSGTVGFVALRHNRKYIGIELNEEYVNLAKNRISEEVKKFNEEQKQEVQKE